MRPTPAPSQPFPLPNEPVSVRFVSWRCDLRHAASCSIKPASPYQNRFSRGEPDTSSGAQLAAAGPAGATRSGADSHWLWGANDAGTESLYNAALEAEEGMTKWQVYKGAKFHLRAYSHSGPRCGQAGGQADSRLSSPNFAHQRRDAQLNPINN